MALMAAEKDVLSGALPNNLSGRKTWAAPFIAAAEKAGFTLFQKTTLNVNAPAKRGEVILTMLEALGIPLTDAPSTYKDVPKSSPYAKAIATATSLGIVSGDKDASGTLTGTFRPTATINRAEVSKMIMEALKDK